MATVTDCCIRQQALLASKDPQKWAFGFYSYDHVCHVNVRVADLIGPWDDAIPYYPADCDYYGRARHEGLVSYDYDAGDIYDVASCLPDVDSLLLSPATRHYTRVTRELQELEVAKISNKAGRNTWQQESGKARHNLYAASRENYRLKWGTDKCDL